MVEDLSLPRGQTVSKSWTSGLEFSAWEQNRQPESPAADFDRLARWYKWMEWFSFGPWLQWCRCAFLDQLTSCREALLFGDGDGRFTARLLRSNQSVTVDAVDASASMLASLVRRAGMDADRVRLHHADARAWDPVKDETPKDDGVPVYDLVATHFFLDCLTSAEVGMLANRIRPMLAEGAVWVVSEFAIPAGWLGKLFARPVIAALYSAFGLLTRLKVHRLPDYDAALRGAGFRLQRRRAWLGGLLVSDLWVSVR
jgi:ubiquinone/menaquinone biosynthesis C-methylase UbiE